MQRHMWQEVVVTSSALEVRFGRLNRWLKKEKKVPRIYNVMKFLASSSYLLYIIHLAKINARA